MTTGLKSNKQARKWLIDQFESTFDVERFDYKKLAAPAKNKAKLYGALVAGVVYGLGFMLAYTGWKNEVADYETFSKFSWIFMIPSSVIGAFSYLIISNRGEYKVLLDLADKIRRIEDGHGMIWRYEPLFKELKLYDQPYVGLILHSRGMSIDRVAPEDYAEAVMKLHEGLNGVGTGQIDVELAQSIERNLDASA